MKKLKLFSRVPILAFLLVLLTTVFGVGNAWATLPSSPKWVATSFDDIADGSTIIIISNSTEATNIALPAAGAGTSNPPKKACTVSTTDGVSTITPPTGTTLQDLAWTIKKKTSTWQFFVEGSTTNCLYLTGLSSNTAVRVGSGTSNNEFTMGSAGNLLKVSTGTRYVGPNDNGGTDWRSYNSETATNYKGAQLTFYVLQAGAPEPTISAASNNESYGTVAVSGTTITATPEAGYRVKAGDAGYTITSGTATVTNNGDNTFTVSASTDCSITIIFEEIPSYTVTWNVNGETSTSQVNDGEKPVFPTPAPTSCDASSTTFVGWATGAWAGKVASVTAETVYTSADAMPAVTAAVTYYAVFAKVEGSGAAVGEKLWAEDFSGFAANDVPNESNAQTTVYGSGSVTYSVEDGGGTTKIYTGSMSAGGVEPELLVAKSNGSFTASGIPVAGAHTATLTYHTNQNLSVTTTTSKVTIGDKTVDAGDAKLYTRTITFADGVASTFDLTFKMTGSSNSRLDDIVLTVATNSSSISDYMTTCAAAGQCAAPTFSVAGGTYNAAQSVELSCETDGATIHYTTNGDAPTSSSATYSSAIAVNENMTIKAIAVKDGSTDSEVAEAVYVLKPATPTISGTDNFLESSTITLACETDGAAIYYTTNGDAPTSSSELYSAPFDIDATTTVKAIAIIANWTNSEVATQEFKKVPTYTVAEALAVIDALDDNASTDSVCVRGVIKEITEVNTGYKNATYLIQDGGVENELTVFRGKYINKADFTDENKDNLQLGDEVLVKGKLKKYVKNEVTTPEIDQNNYIVTYHTKTLADVQVDGAVTKTEYNKGEAFAFNGLQAHAIYDTYYMEDIPFDEVEWTADPATITKDTVVEVGASWHSISCGYIAPVAVTLKKYQLNYILPAQGTLSIKQDETLVSSGTKWVEGTEFTLSSTAPSDDYKAGVYTVTDWGEPANDVTADVLSGNTLTMPKYNVIVTVDFPEKAEADISWSNSGAAVNVHIDNTDDLPTLTKGEFTVTCNSSDENVATVDNDGVVTMVGAGTTTISAVFAGNDDYKAKTVSYELTVLPDFYVTGTAVGGWDSDKVPVAGTSYTIKNLAAGSYKLKITIDGTWGTAKGFSDLTASEVIAGLYNDNDGNICFTLKAAGDVVVTYTGEVYKLAGNFEPQAVKVKGGWDSWTEHAMALSDDKKSASVTVALPAAENVEFGIQINTDDFRANGYNYHRGYTGTAGITGNTGNMKLTSDIAGDYTFTWTFGTNAMNITFPLKEAGLSWGVDAATAYTVGKEYELPTLSNPNNLENVSYESSASAVATIAADGTITLVGTGSTVITATSEATSVYKAGVATYTLTVSAPTSVAVSGSCETDYEKGADFVRTGLVATAKYDDASELDVTASATWTNSLTDNKVNAAGDVTVTAEWQGLSGNKVVTVSLLAHELTFNAPTNGTLVVEYNDAEVATGDHFLKGDVLTITATADPGYKLTSLTVNEADFVSGNNYTVGTEDIAIVATFAAKAAAGLSWGVDAATAYTKGKSYELPTLSNPNGLLVELSSSNEAVAYLDEGQLKIAGAGTATITATSVETGVYAAGEASYTLNVYGPAALAISGEATKTSYEKGDAFDRTGLVASVLYGDASVLVVTDLATWTADPATVTANGNVTVTAEWEGLSDDEEVAVTVKTHKVTFKDYDEEYYVYLSVWNGETQISSGDEFAKGTVLTVEVELESADYVLATLTANTTDIKATKQFTIGEVDVTIEATTEQKPLAPISWSAESASIAMNGDVATLPTLVNELGLGIRYMSNNEEAATIDENTGVITLVGAGVTTITAQSIATEEGAYRTTFVTYTLTVVAIPTALDNAEAGEKAQKIMLNNQLFILRGGKMYDAQGKLVK